MSRCASCVLERPESMTAPVEAFLDELAGCEACPLVEGPDAPAAVRLLVHKHREALRLIRRLGSDARKLRREVDDLAQEAERYEDRVAKLESLHQTSTRELEAQIEHSRAQEEAMRAMSAPVLRLGRDVVALPLIGKVDRARADVLMGKLLDEIRDRSVRNAILDLTGVADIDAETADHLLRILAAARLLGAEVMVTGMRGEVARTLVGLDFDPTRLVALGTVEEALRRCRSSRGR
ncbi:STAS domain-containing protein [Polyangium aurulentum]|uniref:STAS domain-containing protein n=1 Tax=Polyangium aurulentum TaxID=2567896 RepID=UPI0010AE2EDD|nr:STAS domain-containing protein [Polyangium aurulentum]UQA55010.1 STAS domain-containing protein [Polyangium aurulentum]